MNPATIGFAVTNAGCVELGIRGGTSHGLFVRAVDALDLADLDRVGASEAQRADVAHLLGLRAADDGSR